VGRKLLIASIGVATLNYVGVHCGGSTQPQQPVGNLAPPGDASSSSGAVHDGGSKDAIEDFPVANLVAFPDAVDDFPVANLVAAPEAGGKD
jgi:hypothetical protein